jgi:hypothetical protein
MTVAIHVSIEEAIALNVFEALQEIENHCITGIAIVISVLGITGVVGGVMSHHDLPRRC